MKIGLISDTHGWIHPSLYEHFALCDEIWHAGDIGNIQTADSLSAFKPLRAVSGNIDDSTVRSTYPVMLKFEIEEMKIWMIHIGGTPGHYSQVIKNEIYLNPPQVMICGHSHIAKVIYDKQAGLLFINPGAAGYTGFHKYMTAIRFEISDKKIHDLDLIDMGLRGRTGP
jgi:putative phosphoesterase